MGVIIGAIADAIGSIIGTGVKFLSIITGNIVNFILQEVFEPIMSFLGIRDQDIYTVSLTSTPIFEKDQFEKTRTKLILDKSTNNKSSKDYILDYANRGHRQFSKYFYKGKYDFIDYLPTSQFNTVTIPTNKLKEIIEKEKNTEIYIIDILGMVPTDEDWCKYQLQELHNYHILEDYLIKNNEWYTFSSTIYQSDNNTFNVTLSTIENIKVISRKFTEIIITPLNTTKDTKQTIISIKKSYYRIDNGILIKEETEIISDTTTEIDKDSEIGGTTIDYLEDEIINNPINTIVLNVPNHNNTRRYIVKYNDLKNNRFYYWINDPNNIDYANILSPVQKAIDFEMYPIATLRNSRYDINNYKSSSRPPSITEQRYKDTKELLNSLGISVDDIISSYKQSPDTDKLVHAFFLLGINPINKNSIISRVLFEMFEFIYNALPPTKDSTGYSASFKEYPYNAAIMWSSRDIIIEKGTIGNIGTCTHTIRNNTLKRYESTIITIIKIDEYSKKHISYTETYIIDDYGYKRVEKTSPKIEKTITYKDDDFNLPEGTTKTTKLIDTSTVKDLVLKNQITDEDIKIIIVSSIKAVTIINHEHGADGVNLEVDDKNFIIPLSPDIINRLSIIEKTQLFNNILYLQFYAVQHTHLEWYETAQFAAFLKILAVAVTVVVTICTWGSGTGPTITATSALISLLEAATIALALHFTLQLISDYVQDTTLKMLLSIAATAVAMYAGGAFDNFSLIDAAQLANSAVDAVNTYIKDLTSNLVNEINDFSKLYQEKLEVFKDITKELNSGLSIEDIVDVTITSSDMSSNTDNGLMTPSVFYYMAIDAYKNYDLLYALPDNSVSNFVSNKLKLINSGE